MQILLTGASGQLGGAIRRDLAGHDITAPDRHTFNLERGEAIAPFVAGVRPQLIINCAAYTAVDDAERESARAHQVNAVAPGLIAAAARQCRAGLIHFSTDYVFDGVSRRPYRESDACAPLNSYGRGKLDGERAIAASGAAQLIARTSWLYGPRGRNFLTTMLRLGSEQSTLRVVDDQTGAPTSVDAVSAIVCAIVGAMADDPVGYLQRRGGLLNVACSGQTTWHGFATAIFEEARVRGMVLAVQTVEPIPSSQYPTPALRPAYSVFDLGRLRREFGIEPQPWRGALRQIMDQLVGDR